MAEFLGNCCHAKLRIPPRHIANITGSASVAKLQCCRNPCSRDCVWLWAGNASVQAVSQCETSILISPDGCKAWPTPQPDHLIGLHLLFESYHPQECATRSSLLVQGYFTLILQPQLLKTNSSAFHSSTYVSGDLRALRLSEFCQCIRL